MVGEGQRGQPNEIFQFPPPHIYMMRMVSEGGNVEKLMDIPIVPQMLGLEVGYFSHCPSQTYQDNEEKIG